MSNESKNPKQNSSIAPWLSVNNGEKAIAFYKQAFDAVEIYRLDNPDEGVVAKLSVNGAEFWISGSSEQGYESNAAPLGGGNVRMILTILNPEALFEQAVKAGATEIFPVGEDHGWRLGRIADPFGLHWEIGYQL